MFAKAIALVVLCVSLNAIVAFAQERPESKNSVRSVPPKATSELPLQDFRYQGSVGRTLEESDPPEFPQPVRPPKGAPNIVYILIDDAGYGQFGTFGGAVATPGRDSAAKSGL